MQSNICEWIVNQANSNPDKIAIQQEDVKVSYKEYFESSMLISSLICLNQSKRKIPIVVYMEKSYKSLISFVGIACSGNFYSPVDIHMPHDRVRSILNTLQPHVAITTREHEQLLRDCGYEGMIIIYEDAVSAKDKVSVQNKIDSIIDTDLLYVLFTSGSTGVPKGVGITHRAVIDYIDEVVDVFKLSDKDSFGNQAPFYFDNSILDIYCSMKTGGTINIIPENLFAQPVLLLNHLKEYSINTIFWVPSALIVVAKSRALGKVDLSGTLSRVLFCGEVMPTKQLNIWRNNLPNVLYANLYGPTEITDACTYYIVDREFSDDESLPIGKAFKNTEIIVLNEENKRVQNENEVGELCVRGTSLSVGYYNNIDKTKAAFVQNPLNTSYEEKIYRTGDLVKYNGLGELIYLSRKDFQIKHRGHRIELGEIEVAVSAIDGINNCCCLYDEDRSQIVLFIDSDISKEIIVEKLRKKIPNYMIPGKVIYKEKLELNANGKINRKLLKESL